MVMRDLESTLVAFRSGKALPFSTLGFVTPIQSLIKASPQNKSTASMRIKKRERMPAGCWKSHAAPLLHWYLLPPEEWQMNSRRITVHWLNFYQPIKERIMILQCNGFAPKSHSPFRGLRSVVLQQSL